VPRVPVHQPARVRQDRALFAGNDRPHLAQVFEGPMGVDEGVLVGILEMREIDTDIADAVADAEHRHVPAELEQVAGLLHRRQKRAVFFVVDEVLAAPDRNDARLPRPQHLGKPVLILASVRHPVERRAGVPETRVHVTTRYPQPPQHSISRTWSGNRAAPSGPAGPFTPASQWDISTGTVM